MNNVIDTIKNILDLSAADDYEIEEICESGWEFYFIRHKLDQHRAKDVTSLKVKVYKKLEDGKFLGSASGNIPPTATEEEMKKFVDSLVYQAGFVKNPYYEINGPKETEGAAESAVSELDLDVQNISKEFIEAFQAIPETKTEYINSYEIFVSKKDKHFLNSRGIDIRMSYPASLIEVVTNACVDEGKRKEAEAAGTPHEIELYRMYHRGTCDKAALTQDVTELLTMGKDRLEATPTPNLKTAPLILSTQDAVWMFDYFLLRMNAAYKYREFSDWEIGKPIADNVVGDKVTLTALPILPNSSRNFIYDEEGAAVKERVLIRDNVPENFYGSRQFSQYLGLEDSSNVYNYRIEGGEKSAAELRSGQYIEVVEFSGFDCDPITGDIAGEIRLGYYHDGEKTTKITGGSVSGSMRELAKEMYLSKELRQYNDSLVPSVVRLEHATIAGIE